MIFQMRWKKMLKIKKFNSVYWGYLRTAKKPYEFSGNVNAIVGQSGSGKTTLMDSLRIVLGDAKFENNRPMDHYINPKSNWAVVMVVFENSKDYQAPFKISGYTEDEVTVCVRLDRSSGKTEREYYMFDGEFEEIADLGVHPSYYKERKVEYYNYLKILNNAGITIAFKKLMTMRPEEVQNVVDLQPNQLFDKVFQLRGQKAIQDKHDETQMKVQQLIEKEKETYENLVEAESKLRRYEEQKSKYEEYQKDIVSYKKFDLLLKKRNYYDTGKEIEYQTTQKQLLEEELAKLNEKKERLELELNKLLDEKNEKEKILVEKKQLQDQVENEVNQKNAICVKLETNINNKKGVQKGLEEIIPEPLKPLMGALEAKQSEIDLIKVELSKLGDKKRAVEDIVSKITRGEAPLPLWVNRYREALEHGNISFLMLGDCISIKKPYLEWLYAIEGLFGKERYRVVTALGDYLKAKQIQEACEFGARVCTPKAGKRSANKNNLLQGKYISLLDAIDIVHEEEVGGYLNRFSNIYLVDSVEEGDKLQKQGYISLTKKGLLQDQDGAIFLKSRELVCGSFAREKYKAQLLTQLTEIKQESKLLEIEVNNKKESFSNLDIRIRKQQERMQLPTVLQEISDLEQKYKEAQEQQKAIVEQREKVKQEVNESNKHFYECQITATRLDWHSKLVADKIQPLENSISGHMGELTKLTKLYEIYTKYLIESGLTSTDLEFIVYEVEEEKIFIKHYEYELTKEYLENMLKELESKIKILEVECRGIDGSMLKIVEAQKTHVEGLNEEYDQAKQERKEWEITFGEVKLALKHHTKETMNEFMEEVKDMAALLNATAQGKFEQDGEDYHKWELTVKIGFDGKEPRPYYDPSFSKGQRAALSIMLILAAINNKKEGTTSSIMFLDEPTSRVDDYRAGEIGELLQKANVQFFITHQISASLKSANWINYSIVLHKLQEGQEYADNPMIESRRIDPNVC